MTRATLMGSPTRSLTCSMGSRSTASPTISVHGAGQNWRQQVVKALDVNRGERVLDLASGTGTSAEPIASACPRRSMRFSLGMLTVGKRRRPSLPFDPRRCRRLPFGDSTFDAVTISSSDYRNLHDTSAGLEEMLRVTRPGGRLLICEFSEPTVWPLRTTTRST